MEKILLKIKALFRKIGIEIAFVKKESDIIPLSHNTEQSMDAFWANPKNEKLWKSPALIGFYKHLVNLVIENKFDLNNKKILDAGCGTGSLLIFINAAFKPKTNFGYEFSKSALKIAKKRFPNATYQYKNLNEADNTKFDFIFCTEVLEHIISPQIPLKNLINMMKENSGLLITVPNGRTDTFNGHINFWSPESWVAFIKDNTNNSLFKTGEIAGHGLYAIIRKK
ncbi:MAG: hypothetical protein B6I20_10775 [Bacteroidetes bacterium 4572_117]|nr:MAG: hypothetical protein B6I20_10775 [Bacteroidetes bacterium 4572_117]